MTETAIENAPPMDEKAKRTRELLASFYATDASAGTRSVPISPSRVATLDSINSPSFDPEIYMNLLIQRTNLEGLLHKHVEMAAEIKNLDTDLQMLVYENYNKFISATDTIKRMKNNIVGMEANMEQLLEKIISVQSKSDGVNTSLFGKREKIEKLHRTRNFLRKIQFIYDLPGRLQKCIESEAYADAVRLFIGSKPIFEAYGTSSFHECKIASEQTMELVIENLKGKLFSDTEPIEARAEAVVLLKQLNFPVEDLKNKMLDNLEDFLHDFQKDANSEGILNTKLDESISGGDLSDPAHMKSSTQASITGFSKTVNAYRIIFPDSERRLIELTQDLFTKRYKTIELKIAKKLSSEALMLTLRDVWSDTSLMDEVLPDAALPAICLEASRGVIEKFIANAFSTLLLHISEALTGAQAVPKGTEGHQTLQTALESSKKAVIQGSMDCLLDFRHFLDDTLDVVTKMRDLIVDWVQEGFQNFFKSLNRHFLTLCGKFDLKNQAIAANGLRAEKMHTGLILVLAQLSVFIEQSAIPRITEEIAASFSGGSLRVYEYGPAFVPGEICRLFRSASSNFLQIYITMRSQKISTLLKKRFLMPNWIKHKEPREVHMFVDLLLHELQEVGAEVRQILPYGLGQRHHRTESVGSTNSSRSNQVRDDKVNRSNTQRASQLLESHLAKLFEQKMEIFTKIEHTEESVVSAIVKLSLKSIQELVQLQTFNRSGYQQIQLDMEFLKNPLKDIVHDKAVIDFLLKEVHNSAHERCLDPIPLEPPIIDKLIQAKLAKTKDNPVSL